MLVVYNGRGQPKGGIFRDGHIGQLGFLSLYCKPWVIRSHLKSPLSSWDLWIGNQEIKTALSPNRGSLFSGGLGLVSSIAGWNEGSEFKFSSQTVQRILEFGSSPASSGRGEETGSEM